MDKFGDRMKAYEAVECDRRLMPLLPTLARVDGRSFHSFTRGMVRPYDIKMADAMVATALYLAKETNARAAYVQSDEISLAWLSSEYKSQIWFDGRIAKMVSQLGAHATLAFYGEIVKTMPDFAERLPTFDARVWQVPNTMEAANTFLWREEDATKNSISMAANIHYSDKQLHGKHSNEKQEMLFKAGVNWNDYPAFFKRGTFIQRRAVERKFTCEELELLPPNHEARKNPDLVVERSEFAVLRMPRFASVTNRVAVLFEGTDPISEAVATP